MPVYAIVLIVVAAVVLFFVLLFGVAALAWWLSARRFALDDDAPPPAAIDFSRVEKLEREVKSLRLEWQDVYEKLVRVAGRIDRTKGWEQRKSAEREQTEEPQLSLPSPVVPPGPNGGAQPRPPSSRHELLAQIGR